MARRSFTLEFKTSAARLVREQGYSVPQAAQSLGAAPRSIRDWVAKFPPPPPATAPAAADAELRQEVERLRAENKRLLMEREILKTTIRQRAKNQSKTDVTPEACPQAVFESSASQVPACKPPTQPQDSTAL